MAGPDGARPLHTKGKPGPRGPARATDNSFMQRSLFVRRLAGLAAVVLALTSAVDAQRASGRSFLWTVQSGANVMYLAGSVHALTADAYPLNPVYQRAFETSRTLVEEIDLAEADPLGGGLALLRCVTGVAKEEAETMKKKLEDSGAKVEIK